jgi:hypothetical protein
MAQAVEHLPSKCKVLSLNSSNTKNYMYMYSIINIYKINKKQYSGLGV